MCCPGSVLLLLLLVLRRSAAGDDDIMPIWGAGPSGGMLPGGPPLMGPTGGGMHVGPGHPFFADRWACVFVCVVFVFWGGGGVGVRCDVRCGLWLEGCVGLCVWLGGGSGELWCRPSAAAGCWGVVSSCSPPPPTSPPPPACDLLLCRQVGTNVVKDSSAHMTHCTVAAGGRRHAVVVCSVV